jgi:hypothetical protein
VRNKILYKIGLLCGVVPLTVGLLIFFAWWSARAFFAIDLHSLEAYGFLWMLVSIPVACTGLILLTTFAVRNYPQFIRKSVLGMLLILTNIPAAYLVLLKEAELETRAYIKFYNKTKIDDVDVTIKASDFEKTLGKFDDGETIVASYYPKYIDGMLSDSYPIIDTVTLIVKDEFTTRYLKLPRIDKGQCNQLYIDKEFKLLDRWE